MTRAQADDFRAVMLSEFLISASSGAAPVRARLSHVTDGKPAAGIVQFSLTFSAGATALPDGTYRFHHHQLGDFDLFIVPASGCDPAVVYHACITRLVEA